MNKILIILIGLAAAAGIFYFTGNQASKKENTLTKNKIVKKNSPKVNSVATPSALNNSDDPSGLDPFKGVEDDDFDELIKPATQVYSSSAEALAALKKGAKNYDDLILEQFVDPSKKCSWCDELYGEVKDILNDENLDPDEKSYFAEVLAISGRIDNIKTLVNNINNSSSEEDKEIFAEALEVSYGDDELVGYLGKMVDDPNALLQESSIAAITNHGSRLAVDTIYQKTVKEGDPDGYYSLGIGLGEIIPDNESISPLVELAEKNDKFSHLAVKALLNSGPQGVKEVMNVLGRVSSNEYDLLGDAVDHLAYEDETIDILKNVLVDPNSTETQKKFAQDGLDDLEVDLEEEN